MRYTVLIVGALALTAAAQTRPQLYRVDGTLVHVRTRQPVRKARVTIARNDHPDQQASVETGDDGAFHFTDVPAGKYTLLAESRGVRKTFQEDGPYSTGIAVGAGLDSEHIVFPWSDPASLTLEVVDEQGEPVRGAQVMLFQRHIEAGWAQIRLQQQQNSDDEGRCRWGRLERGTYYVAAGGRPWYAQSTMGSQSPESENQIRQLDVAFPTTYYPATSNPEEAAPIRDRPGRGHENTDHPSRRAGRKCIRRDRSGRRRAARAAFESDNLPPSAWNRRDPGAGKWRSLLQ